MVVLKRLAEAERDGNHIYAVLKNIGIASDGRATHVLAPRVEGEELALRRAYEPAAIDPLTVGLMEAHGTGTPVGDVVEVEALRRVFPPRQTESPRCALGSVKSMISHTVPAAGVAGLIKAALALHHKVLPPTLCENPNPKLQLENTNFYINTETRPWIHGSSKTPRRAGVNAFGFGGINAHAILEEYTGPNQAPWMQHDWDSELFVFSGENRARGGGRRAAGARSSCSAGGDALSLKDLAWTLNCNRPMGPVRMAVVGLSHTDLAAKLERAIKRLGDESTRNIKEIEGIYSFQGTPGVEWQAGLPVPRRRIAVPQHAGRSVHPLPGSAAGLRPDGSRLRKSSARLSAERRHFSAALRIAQPGSPLQHGFRRGNGILRQPGHVRADREAGHSRRRHGRPFAPGEHSALLASRVVRGGRRRGTDPAHPGRLRSLRQAEFHQRHSGSGAAGRRRRRSRASSKQQVADSDGELYIALDNCIHQVVLCGPEAA